MYNGSMIEHDTFVCKSCSSTLDEDEDNYVRKENEFFCRTCYRKSLGRSHRRWLFHAHNAVSSVEFHHHHISISHYHGRFFYKGPAISANWQVIETIRRRLERNKIPYQIDQLGLDGIIYAR